MLLIHSRTILVSAQIMTKGKEKRGDQQQSNNMRHVMELNIVVLLCFQKNVFLFSQG
jgi:hypothetical protein